MTDLPTTTPAYIVAISLLLGIVIWGVKILRNSRAEVDENIPIAKLQEALQSQLSIENLTKEIRQISVKFDEREVKLDRLTNDFIELRADFRNLKSQFDRYVLSLLK